MNDDPSEPQPQIQRRAPRGKGGPASRGHLVAATAASAVESGTLRQADEISGLGRQVGTTKAKPRRTVELRTKGLNDTKIATALGVSRRTVQRYLRA